MYNVSSKTLYMFVGLPGSGKSTIADKAFDVFGSTCVILSTDDYIEDKCSEAGLTYDEGFQQYIKEAEKALQVDLEEALDDPSIKVIMWDQTNLNAKTRKKKLKRFEGHEINATAIWAECPEEERQRRLALRQTTDGKTIPENIDQSMVESFEEPTLSEGFDSVIRLRVFEGVMEALALQQTMIQQNAF